MEDDHNEATKSIIEMINKEIVSLEGTKAESERELSTLRPRIRMHESWIEKKKNQINTMRGFVSYLEALSNREKDRSAEGDDARSTA